MLFGLALALFAVMSLPLSLLNGIRQKSQEIKSPQTQSLPVISDSLLEIGQGSQRRPVPQNLVELKVISYNIRWRAGDDLRELIKLFRRDSEIGGAAILGLQEVDRKKKRTENTNTVRLMADELAMHYAWAAPPPSKSGDEEETGVAILSHYPLRDIRRINLPNEGPGRRRRVALGATVSAGKIPIRVYSVHSETRIPVEQKIEQMQAVLKDLEQYPKNLPAVILGDFNTWESSAVTKTHKLFSEASFQTPFDDGPTFSRQLLFFPLELKLDWIWLRNLDAVIAGIDRQISLSDHWPLWCVVKLREE